MEGGKILDDSLNRISYYSFFLLKIPFAEHCISANLLYDFLKAVGKSLFAFKYDRRMEIRIGCLVLFELFRLIKDIPESNSSILHSLFEYLLGVSNCQSAGRFIVS